MAGTSAYIIVAETLRDEINLLAPNSAIETEEQLAKRFSVSRVTIRRALRLLEQSGVVSRQRGRGTVTSPPKVIRTLPSDSIEQDLGDQGIKLVTEVVSYMPRCSSPPLVSDLLKLPAKAAVGELALLRNVGGRSISFEERYFPFDVAKRFKVDKIGAVPVALAVRELARGAIQTFDWELEIKPLGGRAATALKIVPGTLGAVSMGVEYLDDGRPLQLNIAHYRLDRVKFRTLGSVFRTEEQLTAASGILSKKQAPK
ncbi:MAG: GntR family transcriptional regulator [Parvibaculaceae bacterium]